MQNYSIQKPKNRESVTEGRESALTYDFKTVYSFLWSWRGCKSYTNEIEYNKLRKSSLISMFKNTLKFPEPYDNGLIKTNFFCHPMFGATSYLYFKAKNYTGKEAVLYTVITSSLWEFTVEGMVERPSLIDLVVTPVGGVLIGKALEYVSSSLLKSKSRVKRIFARILNPFSLFNEF